ncbi:growth/differentiation factor 8 [Stomoxys calcitrans]|uniref:TGF-beta family profile domain-containing protein n=1 Tax=Stomoxys calcitrans TaxID=35570 RepID=A0A1I8PKJ1_STOCA|nr:growth/differentiation factor 8 [Stomoxys calcitrans]
MAKYFLTFVLLAFLAMENNNIYNRLHAKSQHSSDSNAVVHYMRQQYQYRQHAQPLTNHHPTHDHHKTHHARKHVKQHQRHNSDNKEEEKISRRYGERIKRHMKQQMEHHKEHDQLLQDRQRDRTVYNRETLRAMPRLWQHLSTAYDYGTGEDDINEDQTVFGGESVNESQEYPNDGDILNTDTALLEHDEKITDIVEPQKPAHIGCPKCESSRNEDMISEEELTRLRIEYVKQQILDKLGLKEKPNIPAVSLPKPILEGQTIQKEDDDSSKKDMDDYYARTSKKFIFLEVEKEECQKLESQPSMCFSFKLDDTDADNYEVRTAVLWIFKNKHQNSTNSRNHTLLAENQQKIIVSEVQQETTSNRKPAVKTIAAQTVDVQDEWIKIDIEWPIKRWFGNHELNHLIQITCQSCDMTAMDHIISTEKDYRPFIMVNTQSRKRQTRQKRNINCTHGVTECCREKLYISFADIGWSDWIAAPEGYDAYFCRGSCNTVASVANSGSQHSTFLQKLLNKPGQRRKNLEMVPCCTAKKYSSLQLLLVQNITASREMILPNMVVESCGCR